MDIPPLFSHAFTYGMYVTCHDMSRICDHVMTCHVLMFQVRHSDQVTGHCTDYLLSLYTRSVTRGTMVIFDTNQVVRLSNEVVKNPMLMTLTRL